MICQYENRGLAKLLEASAFFCARAASLALGAARRARDTMLDLERVEVLKGPRNTLFGNNSTGGAINFIAAKPTDVLSAGVNSTIDRFGWLFVESVSGAGSQTFNARLVVSDAQGAGTGRKRTRPDKDGDRCRRRGIRAASTRLASRRIAQGIGQSMFIATTRRPKWSSWPRPRHRQDPPVPMSTLCMGASRHIRFCRAATAAPTYKAGGLMNQNINHVDHIMWMVHFKNQEVYVRQLSELFKVKFDGPFMRPDMGLCSWLTWEGGLEVLAPLDDDTPAANQLREELQQKGEGFWGMAFGVPHIQRAREHALRLGYQASDIIENTGSEPWHHKTQTMKEVIIGDFLGVKLIFGEIVYRDGIFQTQRE